MNKQTALIIEDDALMRDILRQILLGLEFGKIINCQSFVSAKNKMTSMQCDVAFVDIELGDGNGLNLIKDIQKNMPTAKIVIVSGHASADNVKQAVSKGAHAFITKPFNVTKLLSTLKKVGLPVPAT